MNRIINNPCEKALKELEDNSVDLIVTDPPYGYSFMGKDWDKAVPSVEVWKECLRVLKPGAFAFIMSAPRQDVLSQMIVRIGEAGFDTCYTSMYHTYASGFPKAINIHKKLTKDAEAGKHRLQELFRASLHQASSDGKNIIRAPLSALLEAVEQGAQYEVFAYAGGQSEGAQVSEGRAEHSLEGGTDIPQAQGKLCVCEICSLPVRLRINGEEGWLCDGAPTGSGEVTWTVIDQTGMRTSFQSRPVGQPTGKLEAICEQCRAQTVGALDGAFGGFNPKPAVEVVIVAMKPLSEKTYVDQALKNGKGITWLDDCRVPLSGEVVARDFTKQKTSTGENGVYGQYSHDVGEMWQNTTGRFPANLLVSDDVLNDGKIDKPKPGRTGVCGGGAMHEGGWKKDVEGTWLPDPGGSYSRYFDLDKWAAAHLTEQQMKTFPFAIFPKASKSEKNEGLDGLADKEAPKMDGGDFVNPQWGSDSKRTLVKNHHPTVKPLKLMSYLITLGSREGDVVLDPFLGSGTTACAAKALGRKYIGIEMSREYAEIARARVLHTEAPQSRLLPAE